MSSSAPLLLLPFPFGILIPPVFGADNADAHAGIEIKPFWVVESATVDSADADSADAPPDLGMLPVSLGEQVSQ